MSEAQTEIEKFFFENSGNWIRSLYWAEGVRMKLTACKIESGKLYGYIYINGREQNDGALCYRDFTSSKHWVIEEKEKETANVRVLLHENP